MRRFCVSCLSAVIMTFLLYAVSQAGNDFFSEDGGSKQDTSTKDFFADKPTKSGNSSKDLFKDDGGSYTSGGYLDDIEAHRKQKAIKKAKQEYTKDIKRREDIKKRYENLKNNSCGGFVQVLPLCKPSNCGGERCIQLIQCTNDESKQRAAIRHNERAQEVCDDQKRDLERQYEKLLDDKSATAENMRHNQKFESRIDNLNAEYEKEMEYVNQQQEKRKRQQAQASKKRKQQQEALAQQQQNAQDQKRATGIAEQERQRQEAEAKKSANQKEKDDKLLQWCLHSWARTGDDGSFENFCDCAKFVKEYGPARVQNMSTCGK